MALKQSPLKVLCAVVPRNKLEQVTAKLNSLGVCASFCLLGKRTNYSKIVGMAECAAIICVVPTQNASQILKTFYDEMEIQKLDGIAFTTNINAISKNALFGLFDMYKSNQQTSQQNKEDQV